MILYPYFPPLNPFNLKPLKNQTISSLQHVQQLIIKAIDVYFLLLLTSPGQNHGSETDI